MQGIFMALAMAAGSTVLTVVLFPLARRTLENDTQVTATQTNAAGPPPWLWSAAAGLHTGIALMLSLYYHTARPDILRTLVMCSILWPCAWADFQAFLIPNRVLLAGCAVNVILLGIELLAAPAQAVYLLVRTGTAVLALLAATLLCRLISPKAVGMGDIKLLAVMGFCLGNELVWGAVFFSLLVMFFYGIFVLVTRRAKRTDSIPLAPFLLIGTIAAAFLTGI